MFSGITVPAAMMLPSPMLALFRITEPMPIRQRSPMVHPCSVTEWPMVTHSPTMTGYLWRMPCSTLQSCTLELAPMRMECTSPRSTAFIHTLEFSARITSPMICAESST